MSLNSSRIVPLVNASLLPETSIAERYSLFLQYLGLLPVATFTNLLAVLAIGKAGLIKKGATYAMIVNLSMSDVLQCVSFIVPGATGIVTGR